MSVNGDFAHRELRDLAFSDPRTVLAVLEEPAGLDALARVWNGMAAAAGLEERVAGRDFASTVETWPDGLRVGVLRLPGAAEERGVLLTALVVGREVRYFTLEAARRGGRHVLCEWERRPDGFGHSDYGAEVDPPEPVVFAEVVRRVALGGGA